MGAFCHTVGPQVLWAGRRSEDPAGPAHLLWIVKAHLAVCREDTARVGGNETKPPVGSQVRGGLADLDMAGCLMRAHGQSIRPRSLRLDGGMVIC